jgi:hypothetical protein
MAPTRLVTWRLLDGRLPGPRRPLSGSTLGPGELAQLLVSVGRRSLVTDSLVLHGERHANTALGEYQNHFNLIAWVTRASTSIRQRRRNQTNNAKE